MVHIDSQKVSYHVSAAPLAVKDHCDDGIFKKIATPISTDSRGLSSGLPGGYYRVELCASITCFSLRSIERTYFPKREITGLSESTWQLEVIAITKAVMPCIL